MAQRLMGNAGEVIMIVLLLMAVMSTGSAEIIAVTSILVYDIYQLYLKVRSPDFYKLSSETKLLSLLKVIAKFGV